MKCIKCGIYVIAGVIDTVLLTQNSEEESIYVIFPSIFLCVHSHLDARVIIIQTVTEPEGTFLAVPLQFG